jgi:hypothetical protein
VSSPPAQASRTKGRCAWALRKFGLRGVPVVEAAGTLGLRSIRRPTEQSHAEVLALIDELVALGTEPRVGRKEAAAQLRLWLAGRDPHHQVVASVSDP